MEEKITNGRENSKWKRKQQIEEKVTTGRENNKWKRK